MHCAKIYPHLSDLRAQRSAAAHIYIYTDSGCVQRTFAALVNEPQQGHTGFHYVCWRRWRERETANPRRKRSRSTEPNTTLPPSNAATAGLEKRNMTRPDRYAAAQAQRTRCASDENAPVRTASVGRAANKPLIYRKRSR